MATTAITAPAITGEMVSARLSAQEVLGDRFDERGTFAYGGRSMVFFSERAVLKVYTRRWSNPAHWAQRLARELAGLKLAGGLADLTVPEVRGHHHETEGLAWIAYARLADGKTGEERPPLASTGDLLAATLARLHSPRGPMLADLPPFVRRVRDMDVAYPDPHRARARLTAALVPIEERHRGACVPGFVHGDYSSRNVLMAPGHLPGVIDFEGCGLGCVYEDLATLITADCLLGSHDEQALLTAYAHHAQLLGAPAPDRLHVAFHIAYYLRWVLRWAVDFDKLLAMRISAITPRVLGTLT